MKKRLNIDKERLSVIARQALSPAFLLILLGSFVLWYATKLSYDYNTYMPLNVKIDGQRYKVVVEVYGRGSDLMAQKLSLSSKINLKLDELSPTESENHPGSYILNEKELLDLINNRTKNLRVSRIVTAPEFTPASGKETRREKRARKRLERMEKENDEDILPFPELDI